MSEFSLDLSSLDDAEASSTIGPDSSPDPPLIGTFDLPLDVPFLSLDLPDDDTGDFTYEPSAGITPERLSDEEKAYAVLQYMRASLSRFSLRKFLETIFRSQSGGIRRGGLMLMEEWWERGGIRDEAMCDWVVMKAAKVCKRECDRLTSRAARGPHSEDAKFLRVSPSRVSVAMINSFRIDDLLGRYERVTPHLQSFLKAVIGKEGKPIHSTSRNPDHGRAMLTSSILNLASRETNYHLVANSLIMWDNRVPKRLLQMMNRLGLATSFDFLSKAVVALSKDSVRIGKIATHDPSKLKLLPYDNFNWMSQAWEKSAIHGSVQHDQVSAMLVIFRLPTEADSPSAEHLASVTRFVETIGTRHTIPADIALERIVPNSEDQKIFWSFSIIHVVQILSEESQPFAHLRSAFPKCLDPKAIPAHKTEQHYLPTFDQEQGSTHGNMDQRAVDRSPFRVDHLSSFAMTSRLMHVSLNFLQAAGKNFWGGSNQDDASLLTLRDLLPNRNDINIHKFDFYGWLRFLDVVLRSLVVQVATRVLNLPSPDKLSKQKQTPDFFTQICQTVVDSFIMPSPGRLEADGVKTLRGNTQCGHAVLLIHDLMTLREMRDAIKQGHPTWILWILKYWTPMFYAGRSYNYSNKWMLVNTSGEPEECKEVDINVEHLNLRIKDRAHRANATPELLEKVTPAIGHVRHLTDQAFTQLILAKHLHKSHILDFGHDKQSEDPVIDLYRNGLRRLAGSEGGHTKHLLCHKLWLRSRHGTASDTFQNGRREGLLSERELLEAGDAEGISYTIEDEDDVRRDIEDMLPVNHVILFVRASFNSVLGTLSRIDHDPLKFAARSESTVAIGTALAERVGRGSWGIFKPFVECGVATNTQLDESGFTTDSSPPAANFGLYTMILVDLVPGVLPPLPILWAALATPCVKDVDQFDGEPKGS
ncbi:hypothetical protein JAAARDRAFT_49395 [Jaapia argillacea MUCL 33604]|uniref:DUF6589 domain-containing protein n=1 Tax=Jaapia argillacea MUCL 33604 TaxID=933084 RepID=A0A067PRT6_9AGAM|nr:hypothetical protein JAAARDRAFT_49395 [Jaapia argillacea MUCL 33604]